MPSRLVPTGRAAGTRLLSALLLAILAVATAGCASRGRGASAGGAATPSPGAATTAAPVPAPGDTATLGTPPGAAGARTPDRLLRPHAAAGGWLFSCRAPAGTRSVHLAGEFNGWSTTAWPMTDADGDGIWTLAVPLEAGRTYAYKFVLNGSEWVTDPNAEEIDPNNYHNGILVTRPPGEPYLAGIDPADGARVTAVPRYTARLHLEGRSIARPGAGGTGGPPVEVRLADFQERRSWRPAAALDTVSGRVDCELPADLPDDDYRVTVTVSLAGAPPLSRTTVFSLDRWAGRVDAPAFYDRAVIYEVFVRSFRDGRGGDGTGDLEGLIRSLDYLNDGDPGTHDDLEVDALWLMPVHPSPSYHGYDVTDYEGIEEDYGNLEDYRRLVTEAHRRGIRVILDYVVNHSSNRHPFFESSLRNPSSPYTRWYQFTDDRNEGCQGFAGIREMPQFDFRSAEMRAYLLRMARFWIDLDQDGDHSDGVDGFRCDVAKGPPHNFWKELRREVRGLRGDFLLLAEVWDDARTIAPYYHAEFDMNFDYPLYYAMLDHLLARSAPDAFRREYERGRALYPPGAQLCRFLDNHDNNRIASVLGGDERRIRLATGILLTLPGTPLLYYGTEVGMQGTKPDPDIRKPMRWDLVAAQTGDPSSLLSWHRELIRLRHALPELTAPDDAGTRSCHPGRAADPEVLVFERRLPSGGPATLVVANLSRQAVETMITVTGSGAAIRGLLAEVTPGRSDRPPGRPAEKPARVDLARGHLVQLDPSGVRIFRLQPD